MNKKSGSKSIAFKLAGTFIFSMIFQSILLISLMVGGGVLNQTKQNQFEIFSEKVNGRMSNLENQMNHIWINFEHNTNQISRYFERIAAERTAGKQDQMLEDLAPILIDMLYHTKTTGAFLILPEKEKQDSPLAALYFRNNSPERTGRDESNLYMLIGPWNVAEKLEIATTANWSLRLNLTAENQDFVMKPLEAAEEYGRSEWLGYWSPPFRVNPQDEAVITYSAPLFGPDDEMIAIVGVEISVSYLYHFLPAWELQTKDSYGYVIGIGSEEEGLRAAVTNGGMQKRMLEADAVLQLEEVDSGNAIFRLQNHNSSHAIYACVSRMGMYYHNTPFEEEEWFLIGLMEKPVLFRFPHKMEHIFLGSFLLSMGIGFLISILISQWFTKHAKLIELSELPVGAFEMRNRSGKVLMTSQIPHLLGLTKEQERAFAGDKRKMFAYLKEICAAEGTEENVFRLERQGEKRYVRMSRKSASGRILCVVEDVTEEILRTRALKVERDRDGLTGVKNRLAFEKMAERYTELLQGGERKAEEIVLVMCDLNNLKAVNDKLGHDRGDAYIRKAAELLCEAFDKEQVFRIGGDEFAVLAQGFKPDEIRKEVSRLEAAMRVYGRENGFAAGLACGTACFDPVLDIKLEDTLSRADAQMYRKKNEMKGR